MSFTVNSGKGDIEDAEKAAEKGLEKVSSELPKEKDLDVDLGWTSQEFVVEEMGGATGMTFNPERMELKFNSGAENWRKNLEATAIHEYVHTWHYEKIGGRAKVMWRYVISEALTQHFEEKRVPEADHRKQHKFSKDEIAEHWSRIKKEQFGRQDSKISKPLFVSRGEEYPNWLGYSMSYLIGKELLKEHDPEEFPELEKKDVIKTGDELFNHDN